MLPGSCKHIVILASAIALPLPAQAQDVFMQGALQGQYNAATVAVNTNVARQVGQRQGKQADGSPAQAADAALPARALTYTPSPERRRANLAGFVEKSRAGDPAGAEQMARLFASTDVIAQIGQAIAPYGLSVDNLADAYAVWWITAWEGAQGSNRTFSQSEMRSVRTQARNALRATPQLGEATEAQKQEMAEAMLIQAVMIDSMVDMAKQNPELMPQLKASIRQGAKASGLDLDKMVLTENGFVAR